MTTNSLWAHRFLAGGLLAALVALAALGFDWSPGAQAAQRPALAEHDDHTKKEAALRKTFEAPVDVYYDPTEITGKEPSLSGMTFVGLADVTGKELLVFAKGKEQWLIDPDYVYAFRLAKGK